MSVVLVLLTLVSVVWACEVTLPHQLVVLGEDKTATNLFSNVNCSDEVMHELQNTVCEVQGNISARQLIRMMNQKGFADVKIEPPMVRIHQLRNIIREQLMLPPGVHVKATRAVNTSPVLALAQGDRLEVQCSNCLYGNQQPMHLVVHNFDGSKRSVMTAVDFKKMVRAYRVLNTINSFSEIRKEDLREEFTEAIPHTKLVTDAEALRFFKTNKPIRTGELLKQADLNATNLVRAGLKTQVLFTNSLISIKTEGISRSNGTIGETVEVYHPQKNKKYQGKVVDENKVLIEL